MLSPIDEYQYIGYYAVVADQGIVRRGEAMPFYARKYVVCNGVRNIPEMQVNPRPAASRTASATRSRAAPRQTSTHRCTSV